MTINFLIIFKNVFIQYTLLSLHTCLHSNNSVVPVSPFFFKKSLHYLKLQISRQPHSPHYTHTSPYSLFPNFPFSNYSYFDQFVHLHSLPSPFVADVLDGLAIHPVTSSQLGSSFASTPPLFFSFFLRTLQPSFVIQRVDFCRNFPPHIIFTASTQRLTRTTLRRCVVSRVHPCINLSNFLSSTCSIFSHFLFYLHLFSFLFFSPSSLTASSSFTTFSFLF